MLFVPDVERDSNSGWLLSQERWAAFSQPPAEAGKRRRRAVSHTDDVISLADSEGSDDEAYQPTGQRRRARPAARSLSRLAGGGGGFCGGGRSLPGTRSARPSAAAGLPRGRPPRELDATLPVTLGGIGLGLAGLGDGVGLWDADAGAGKVVLRGDALGQALRAQPDLSLAAYNASDSRAWLPETELHWAIMRCAATPAAAGAVVDAAQCSAPFIAGPSTPADLAPLLGFGVLFHLGRDVDAMLAARESPVLVLVPLAAVTDPPIAAAPATMSDAADSDRAAPAGLPPPQHTMLFVPDRASAAGACAGSGWLVPSNFLKRHRPPHARALSGTQVNAALIAWPELSLAAHNAVPCVYAAALPHLTLRTAVSAAPLARGEVLDPALISAPFCGCAVPDYVAPAVGVSDVSFQLGRALAALRRSGVAPMVVLVPLVWADAAPPDAAAAAADEDATSFVRLALVPDEVLGGGWLVAPERGLVAQGDDAEPALDVRRQPQSRAAQPPPHPLMQLCDDSADAPEAEGEGADAAPAASSSSSNFAELLFRRVPRSRDHVLPGPVLAAALVAHPHLSLAAYNAAPLHSLRSLMGASTRAWLRASAAPATSGAAMDPRLVSAPVLGRTVPARLLAAVGVSVVYNQTSRALAALRAAPGPPLVALVPFCFPATAAGLVASPAPPSPQLLPALWVPDPSGSGGFLFLRCDELMPAVWPGSGSADAIDALAAQYAASQQGNDDGEGGASDSGSDAGGPGEPPLSAPTAGGRHAPSGRSGRTSPAAASPVVAPPILAPAVVRGPALAAALASHPLLTLAAYNAAPTIHESELGAAILRVAATPAAGDVIDAAAATAPFTALGGGLSILPLGPVLGSTDCSALIDQAARALYTCLRVNEGLARCVSVSAPIARVRQPAVAAAAADAPYGQDIRDLVFVPDESSAPGAGSGGGWLISAKQWARVVKEMAAAAATAALTTVPAAPDAAVAAAALEVNAGDAAGLVGEAAVASMEPSEIAPLADCAMQMVAPDSGAANFDGVDSGAQLLGLPAAAIASPLYLSPP